LRRTSPCFSVNAGIASGVLKPANIVLRSSIWYLLAVCLSVRAPSSGGRYLVERWHALSVCGVLGSHGSPSVQVTRPTSRIERRLRLRRESEHDHNANEGDACVKHPSPA